MIDFTEARTKMVDCQVRTVDVTSHGILSAMLSVPREEFVPEGLRPLAYIDEDLKLNFEGDSSNRRLLEAGPFSKLLQLAEIKPDDFVLDIGCGSGYSTAVLSLLCSSVVAIDEDAYLANLASEKLMDLGYLNTAVVEAPHAQGYASEGPYDVILLEGSVGYVPKALFDQLKDGGRLVAVEGQGNAAVAKVYLKSENLVSDRTMFNCSIPPLPGLHQAASFKF